MVLGSVAAVFAVAAGGAWACTVQAPIIGVSPAAAPERALVTVAGSRMVLGADGNRQVEIRWQSVDGPVLGTGDVDADGRFSAEVAVPTAAPGIHSLVAVTGGASIATALEVSQADLPPQPTQLVDPAQVSERPVLNGEPSSRGTDMAAPGAILLVGLSMLGSGTAAVLVRRRRAVQRTTAS